MNSTESITEIGKAVAVYRERKDIQGDEICDLLRIISTHLYYLAEQKADAYKRYQTVVFNLLKDEKYKAVSRAENIAEIQVPELYLYRQIIDAAERVCDALRSHLSLLKQQKQNV